MTEQTGRVVPLLPLDDVLAQHANFFILRSHMVAPDDPAMRHAIQARDQLKMLARAVTDSTSEGTIEVSRDLISALADDHAMKQLYGGFEASGDRKGFVAGFVLIYLYLMSADRSVHSSLHKALHLATEQAKVAGRWGDGAKIAQTPRQTRANWDSHRSVSHFWAADLLMYHRYASREGQNFTYGTHVVEMIEWAEAFRLWLEKFVPFRATSPLVTSSELWRLPASYHVASRSLPSTQAELGEQLRAWLRCYKTPTMKFYD